MLGKDIIKTMNTFFTHKKGLLSHILQTKPLNYYFVIGTKYRAYKVIIK